MNFVATPWIRTGVFYLLIHKVANPKPRLDESLLQQMRSTNDRTNPFRANGFTSSSSLPTTIHGQACTQHVQNPMSSSFTSPQTSAAPRHVPPSGTIVNRMDGSGLIESRRDQLPATAFPGDRGPSARFYVPASA